MGSFSIGKSTIGKTIAAIEATNDMYCIQKRIEKISPWGPELIWQLATKYKMCNHQRHLQYVIMHTITNEGGHCRINLAKLDFLQFPA